MKCVFFTNLSKEYDRRSYQNVDRLKKLTQSAAPFNEFKHKDNSAVDMDRKEKKILQDVNVPECTGIDAPMLIKQDIIADEITFKEKSEKNEHANGSYQARRANDEETNASKQNSSKESSHVDKNPELNKESEVDTTIKDTIEHGNLKRSFHTEKVDDANNNIQHDNPEMKKDGRRRTRFSSEITMQPKLNQPHSVDMIIMMESDSNEIHPNKSRDVSSTNTHRETTVPTSHPQSPSSFLLLTAITCVCCPMIGLFAVYKSVAVKQSVQKGEIQQAHEASAHARQLGILTVCVGLVFVVAIVIITLMATILVE
ncbi:uncharacterized protein LOC124451483 isoform X2 [Xenia sp. Carnegie-2017]|uniref:uncharacterized protein LOC124451483 isoform X2 n=1 Tax=Xenia sp. Carnegie-2017 TaxID=2897299 RepID=UPI001F03FCF5|nr:uncharacterized protein LOC124451483 isoform X2 [Xenia sp. Carnegie-2017]